MNFNAKTSVFDFIKQWRRRSAQNELSKVERELAEQTATLEHWSAFKCIGKDAGVSWEIVERCGKAKTAIAGLKAEKSRLEKELIEVNET